MTNPFNDALRILKGLQSAVEGGVMGYRDFAPRVTDAKIQIDQLLADAPDSPAKACLEEAFGFYLYAANAWDASIAWDASRPEAFAQFKVLEENPLYYKCEPLKRVAASKAPGANGRPAESLIADVGVKPISIVRASASP